MRINGMNIIASPLITEVPRIQLSHDFNVCSPEFKVEFNQWLKEHFGTYLPVYVISGNTIAMHPKQVALLKLEVTEGEKS